MIQVFTSVNHELNKNEWFISNKLSLNVKNTKYTFFHKTNEKDDIPLLISKFGKVIVRTVSVKFAWLMLHEHVLWNEHVKYIQNKISQNLGIPYKAKIFA